MIPRDLNPIVVQGILCAFKAIAPEYDLEGLKWDVPLRNQVELDSMDHFHILIALYRETGVDIPASEYSKLKSLQALAQFISTGLDAKATLHQR